MSQPANIAEGRRDHAYWTRIYELERVAEKLCDEILALSEEAHREDAIAHSAIYAETYMCLGAAVSSLRDARNRFDQNPEDV